MNKINLGWLFLGVGVLGVILGFLFLSSGKVSDSGRSENSFKSWLPILISSISFFVSAYTLWSTSLAPFDLNVVSTGRVVLTSNPSSPGAMQPAISIQLLFSNRGAKHGYVSDVALVLRKDDRELRPILFRSLYEQLEDTLNLTKELPPPKLLTFTSFPIQPGDSKPKNLVFVPFDKGTELRYEQARYSIVPYTLEANAAGEWKAWSSIEIEILPEDLKALDQRTVTQTEGGGQFVKWVMQSKPTIQQENYLKALRDQLERNDQTRK